MKKLFIYILSLCVLTFGAENALASAASSGASKFPLEDLTEFSKAVEKSLADRGARVAIVARIGRNPKDLPEGVSYTHVAFWVYSKITTEDGREVLGYQIYNLYQDAEDRDRSDLVKDYPIDYFAGAHQLKAGIIIPDEKLQKKLLNVIASDSYARLHNPKYSVVANPHNNQLQNCTEHTLNIVLSALYGTDDINVLKANAAEYFKPQKITLGVFETLLGPIFVEDFYTRDHRGDISTATYTTLKNFMQSYDLVDTVYTVSKGI